MNNIVNIINQTTAALTEKNKAEKPSLSADKTQDNAKKQQAAKEFEALVLSAMMKQMQKTGGNLGLESDAASEQIQGIFWMHLGQELGTKGGIGLWRNIYKHLDNKHSLINAKQSMDISL